MKTFIYHVENTTENYDSLRKNLQNQGFEIVEETGFKGYNDDSWVSFSCRMTSTTPRIRFKGGE